MIRPGGLGLGVEQLQRELETAGAELDRRRHEIARLERELEETNRGVVALYAELEEQAEHLREANATKSRFLSSVSHEFRTPLNSIRALARLLLERADGDLTVEQEKQVAFIRRAAEDLSTLVNDLLDLAKIDAGRVDVHPAPFEVDALLRSLHGSLRPLLANEKVRLVIEEARDLPTLDTDEGKLSQILRNLVSNALKFTTEGEVRVWARRAATDSEIVISVADTGIGIAEQDQARIFSEFVQVEGPHQAGIKGTGLGLPVSRKLVELLGGTIALQSALGRGSVFSVTIPIVYGARPGEPSPAGMLPGASAVPASAEAAALPPQRWTVLVVDDDPTARYLLRSLLRSVDCRVVEAEGGTIGLSLAARLLPDLIVLDLQMPDVSGLEVLRRLRADPGIPPIPVVVNTSHRLEREERAEIEGLEATIVIKGETPPDVATAAFVSALRRTGRVDDPPGTPAVTAVPHPDPDDRGDEPQATFRSESPLRGPLEGSAGD